MTAKNFIISIVVVLAMAVVAITWRQHLRAQEAEAVAAQLVEERDSIMAEAALAIAQAAADGARADSLEAQIAQQKAEADAQAARDARRARSLAREADSLQTAIVEMVPEGEIREQVEAAVVGIRAGYEERLTAKDNQLAAKDQLLGLSAETIAALRDQVSQEQAIQSSLRAAMGLMQQEIDVWHREARPGLFGWIGKNAGKLAGVAGVFTIVGAAVG